MTHLAIDLAVHATGVCWGPGPTDCEHRKRPHAISRQPFGATLRYWRKYLREFIADDRQPRITAVVVEAPFIDRSRLDGTKRPLKLHGAIEHMVATAGLPYDDTIQNSSILARMRVGTGLERKQFDDVKSFRMAVARERCGWQGTSHDEADAVLLWHYVAELRERGAA